MPIGLAVTAILTLSLGFACLHIGRDPKMWRLRWMDLLGVLDVETDRDRRKSQERQMSILSHLLFVLFLALSLSCAYWTFDQIREAKREKTRLERDMEITRQEIDGVRARTRR